MIFVARIEEGADILDKTSIQKEGFKKIGSWEVKKDDLNYTLHSNSFAPEKKGVYIFLTPHPHKIERLDGSSDILYIGKTSSSIKQRLDQYKNPCKGQSTNIRISATLKKLLEKKMKSIEIWFKECDKNGDENELEKKLLEKYEEDHWELPPLNRSK